MNKTMKTAAFVALMTLSLAAPVRAADSGEQAKQTKAKIDTARGECAKIRNQIGLTLEELNRLQKDSVELRPQLEKYTAELAKMEEQAKLTRERALSMGEKGREYFKAWEDQITSISNEDIRDQAQKRYNKRAKSYEKISKAMMEARDQLVPFMSDLNDIKTLLDSELSRGSVKSAKKLIKTANWHGDDVVDSLKDVETELDRVSAELAKYE
jgi:chromosome segregation ATPase